MNSYRTHKQTLKIMLSMVETGKLLSRKQAARYFGCREGTISTWLNQLREDGNVIRYSRSLQRYILLKK